MHQQNPEPVSHPRNPTARAPALSDLLFKPTSTHLHVNNRDPSDPFNPPQQLHSHHSHHGVSVREQNNNRDSFNSFMSPQQPNIQRSQHGAPAYGQNNSVSMSFNSQQPQSAYHSQHGTAVYGQHNSLSMPLNQQQVPYANHLPQISSPFNPNRINYNVNSVPSGIRPTPTGHQPQSSPQLPAPDFTSIARSTSYVHEQHFVSSTSTPTLFQESSFAAYSYAPTSSPTRPLFPDIPASSPGGAAYPNMRSSPPQMHRTPQHSRPAEAEIGSSGGPASRATAQGSPLPSARQSRIPARSSSGTPSQALLQPSGRQPKAPTARPSTVTPQTSGTSRQTPQSLRVSKLNSNIPPAAPITPTAKPKKKSKTKASNYESCTLAVPGCETSTDNQLHQGSYQAKEPLLPPTLPLQTNQTNPVPIPQQNPARQREITPRDEREIVSSAPFTAAVQAQVAILADNLRTIAQQHNVTYEDALKEAGFHKWYMKTPEGPPTKKKSQTTGYTAFSGNFKLTVDPKNPKYTGSKEAGKQYMVDRNALVSAEWKKLTPEVQEKWNEFALVSKDNLLLEDILDGDGIWDTRSTPRVRKESLKNFTDGINKWAKLLERQGFEFVVMLSDQLSAGQSTYFGTRLGKVFHSMELMPNDCSHVHFDLYCYEKGKESKRALWSDLRRFGLFPKVMELADKGRTAFIEKQIELHPKRRAEYEAILTYEPTHYGLPEAFLEPFDEPHTIYLQQEQAKIAKGNNKRKRSNKATVGSHTAITEDDEHDGNDNIHERLNPEPQSTVPKKETLRLMASRVKQELTKIWTEQFPGKTFPTNTAMMQKALTSGSVPMVWELPDNLTEVMLCKAASKMNSFEANAIDEALVSKTITLVPLSTNPDDYC